MNEFIGLAYYAEVPAVIFDVQRVGPSTGMPTRTQQCDLMLCAYASHGDTRHVLLFPSNPEECFYMAVQAFDLAERLQTPVFVMSDLDIGMNDWMCKDLAWDDAYRPDRGKVLTKEEIEALPKFHRYLDKDDDGIPYRTVPGAHPTRGAYFTRGSTRDAYARYSEAGPDYVYNMERLLRKFDSAKALVPQPVVRTPTRKPRGAVIYYGSTSPAMDEALELLEADGQPLSSLRIRAFPFPESVASFIAGHDKVFVVEQNRDAQLKTLLVNELGIDPARLVPILHYDGTPITARFIVEAIGARLKPAHIRPLAGGKAA
jgi:2-oxoglutarate ferredoxin oxidoreductase subunit alpha